ncbi:DUF2510 domain-containing protein [Streptomyces sp.]|uniref:DUF2510 domain-containing protein n=1 Tax=Streptomyces sp. TaxID=1931 RepID=UPI002D22E9DE|nr:DUF2510 domain-containing protein [Streptomyces sp.]HZF88602.1 DUF2510 domain-containing protein [Streptomyces sp.]
MTQVTPPGWYPDPGQTSDGPATDRWWDGKAWTDQIRPAGPAAAWGPPAGPPAAGAGPAYGAPVAPPGPAGQPGQPAYPGQPGHPERSGAFGQAGFPVYPAHPGYPGYPVQPPPTSRRGLRTGIAAAVAAAVLASIGFGVYTLTKEDGGGTSRADSRQERDGRDGGSGGPDGDQSPGPGEPQAPEVEGGGTLSDTVNGISMPVPDGWTGQAMEVGAQMTSDDTYPCPGETSQTCTKGGAYSAPAELLGTRGGTAEAVAKADIAANAKESYGGSSYGEITSHQVLASKAVTVAGQKGYLVRWKAVTSKGADGLVQSLAFPSPADGDRIVVVRCGVDADQKVSLLDEITEGIEAGPAAGNGQDV